LEKSQISVCDFSTSSQIGAGSRFAEAADTGLAPQERHKVWIAHEGSRTIQAKANQTLASTSRVSETGIEVLLCRVGQAFSIALDKWKLDTMAPGFPGTAGKRLLQSTSDKVTQFHSPERRFGFDSLEEGVKQVNRRSRKSVKAGLRFTR
jgi:hypothetical protein